MRCMLRDTPHSSALHVLCPHASNMGGRHYFVFTCIWDNDTDAFCMLLLMPHISRSRHSPKIRTVLLWVITGMQWLKGAP